MSKERLELENSILQTKNAKLTYIIAQLEKELQGKVPIEYINLVEMFHKSIEERDRIKGIESDNESFRKLNDKLLDALASSKRTIAFYEENNDKLTKENEELKHYLKIVCDRDRGTWTSFNESLKS
jgi:non-homologous end joining protein Ku